MNVLIVTPFFSPKVGGIETHVLNLTQFLAKKGNKITILTSLLDGTEKYNQIDANIEVIRVHTIFLPSWPIKSMSNFGFVFNIDNLLEKIIREKNIDIIHAHGFHYPITWAAINISKKISIPSVLTIHGFYLLNPDNYFFIFLNKLFNFFILPNLLKNSNAIISLTKSTSEEIKCYFNSDKYFVIPNGIDVAKFIHNKENINEYRKKYGIPKDSIIISFFGRLEQAKGIIELTDAMKIILKNFNNIFFIVIGGGTLKNNLEKKLNNYKEKVLFTNWVPQNLIHELYAITDIFILPSKREALPITILEAMASSLFIITTPVGGIPDILIDYKNKIFLKDVSIESINNCLEELLLKYNKENYYYEKINDYDWELIGNKTQSLYSNLIYIK